MEAGGCDHYIKKVKSFKIISLCKKSLYKIYKNQRTIF